MFLIPDFDNPLFSLIEMKAGSGGGGGRGGR